MNLPFCPWIGIFRKPILANFIKEGMTMDKRLSLDSLIKEKDLAEALSVSRETLAGWRPKGCPWLNLGGKVFYHEGEAMEWLLKNQKRVSDAD